MAIWTMIPCKIEEKESQVARRFGVFGATVMTFFLAEMGDKTQVATIALAAHYGAPLVVAGTTLGIPIAEVPAAFVHTVAAAIFAALGIAALGQWPHSGRDRRLLSDCWRAPVSLRTRTFASAGSSSEGRRCTTGDRAPASIFSKSA